MALAFLTVVMPSIDDIRGLQQSVGRQYVEQFLSRVETLQDLPYEMLSPDAISRLTQVFKMFDKNADGKLDDTERTAMITFVKNFQAQQQQQPKQSQ
jgi:hypothetical protein